jgi:hypothetical protein
MEITFTIPDELARLLGTTGDIERRALEALVLAEYQAGRLTRPALRRLLGFETRFELDGFLKAHSINEGMTPAEFARDWQELDRVFPDQARREKARRAAANIIARRKGVTLGDLKIKDLINEGRP